MQNYVNLTAEDMTFDMSNVQVEKYGENEFSGDDDKYNGKEVPIFNNNVGTMELTDCTVILPTDSEMGMSADGKSVTLVNTEVKGNINLQDFESSLKIDSETKIGGKVIAYFSEKYEVISNASEGCTIYSLKEVSSTSED